MQITLDVCELGRAQLIALSSGEAEYYSLTSAACNALGEQSVL